MSYFEQSFTHGGAGAYREMVNRFIFAGWSVVDSIAPQYGPMAALSGIEISQSNNKIINTTPVSAVDVAIALPVSWILPSRVQKIIISTDASTNLVEGTDYDIDYIKGLIYPRGGIWAGGDTERIRIEQGEYDILNGWVVLSSSGVSTQEANLFIGLRFVSQGGVTGIEWTLFYDFSAGVTDYFSTDETIRNSGFLDLLSLVHPTASGTIFGDWDEDRFVGSISIPEAHNAWSYVGALGRIRPVLEQDCISVMVGSQSELVGEDGDDAGAVGNTLEEGSTEIYRGSVWRYDLSTPQFASDSASLAAQLNCHHWSVGSEGGAGDVPFSDVEFSPGEPYFELHPAACGYSISRLNITGESDPGVLFGYYKGLFSVAMKGPQHRTEVVYQGQLYTILKVGSSITRFIAVEQG